MADVIDLGWIQLNDHNDLFINSNSNSTLVIGAHKESFKFVYQPTKYGAYGLLASSDLQLVIQVPARKIRHLLLHI